MNNLINKFKAVTAEETPRKYGVVLAIIIVISLLLELFVFNFKWLNSIFDKEIQTDMQIVSGVTRNGNSLHFTADEATVEFNNVNKKIKYLHFNPGTDKNAKATIQVSAVDEANEYGLSAPVRTVLSDVKPSQYIRLHFSGNVENLSVRIQGLKNKTVDSELITLNAHVPMMFSWLRFISVIIIGMLLFVLRPSSSLYTHRTDLSTSWQKVCAVGLLVIQIVLLWNTIHWNKDAIQWHKTYEHHKQYYKLVDAFKEGNFYLADKPSEKLIAMENPYDTRTRQAENVHSIWDTAYHDGKYYCYFGAGPVLLLYLPYNLITGNDLPHYVAIFIMSSIMIAGIMLLLWEIIKKWFKNTPFLVYMLLSALFPLLSANAYSIYTPTFYFMPNATAITASVFGLAMWLSAQKNNTLKPLKLAVGSACIAFTALCRPQFLITAVFGVMLFCDDVFKKRTLFSKQSIKPTLAICLPFIIIGAITMWYNAARFGSPFDFGANYNLTTNDMTHRGFVFGRTGLGIFSYLLQPINFDAVFPFLHDFSAKTTYQGLTLTENMLGGVLWLYPILLIGVYGIFKKSLFADKKIYYFVCFSVIISVIIAVLDAQMAGLLTRYFGDFVWLLMIASSLSIFAYYEKYADNQLAAKNINSCVLVLSTISFALAFLSIFARDENSIQSANPTLYYTMQHMIAFWM